MAVGAGWQVMVAYINVGSYYIIGVPLGVLLGYVADLSVKVRLKRLISEINWQWQNHA